MLILEEWRKRRPQKPTDHDMLVFFGWLQRERDNVLRFRSAGDKWHVVHGRSELRLTPLELIERLAALIPPPRVHRHRYHGVLATNSHTVPRSAPWGERERGTPPLAYMPARKRSGR